MPSPQQQPSGIPLLQAVGFGSLVGILSLIGALGNIIVIAAILGSPRMRRSTCNLLLINLASADLLFLIAHALAWLPRFVARSTVEWPLPSLLCPLTDLGIHMGIYGSILTYLAISLERYLAVINPMGMSSARRYSSRRINPKICQTLVVIVLIWVVVVAWWLPNAYMTRVITIKRPAAMRLSPQKVLSPSSSMQYNHKLGNYSGEGSTNSTESLMKVASKPGVPPAHLVLPSALAPPPVKFLHVCALRSRFLFSNHDNFTTYNWALRTSTWFVYVLTVSLSLVLYWRICRVLWKSDSFIHRTKIQLAAVKKRQEVVKMLIVCCTIFFVCYTGMLIITILTMLRVALPSAIKYLLPLLNLSMSSSNPFVYTLFSSNFRQRIVAMMPCLRRCLLSVEELEETTTTEYTATSVTNTDPSTIKDPSAPPFSKRVTMRY